MKRTTLGVLLVLLAASTGISEDAWYRSNSVGMRLERIASYRRDESPWILAVQRSGSSEVRSLLDNGKEVRRWELSTDGGQTVERELADGVLGVRRVYGADGSMLQEEVYAGGALTQKLLYSYVGGRLQRVRTLDPAGATLSSDEYLYASDGSLRAVRRTAPAGAQRTSVVSGASGIFEERTDMGDTLLLARYDAKGRVTSKETRTGGVTVSREDFVFGSGSDALDSSTEQRPGEGTLIQRRYDDVGRLVQETTTRPGGTPAVTTLARDDKGRVVSKSTRGPTGLEAWTYTLRDDGTVSREEYSRRGSREKVTIYGDGRQRTEELYREGEMFLRVVHDGDVRVKEEVWSDGSLVRTRTYP